MAPKFNYSEKDLFAALTAVKNGDSVYQASKVYSVPFTTLYYKSKGARPVSRKMGPATILSNAEENTFVRWILHLGDAGFPVTKEQLMESVQSFLKKLEKKTIFKNNKPGGYKVLASETGLLFYIFCFI